MNEIIPLTFLRLTIIICKDNQTGWKYSNSIKSSITILSQSLQSNRTYQFMVYMENRQNSSVQATGYLLVQLDNAQTQLIAVAWVIFLIKSSQRLR